MLCPKLNSSSPLNPKIVHSLVISTTIHPVRQARSLGILYEFSVSLASMSNQLPGLVVSTCQYLLSLFFVFIPFLTSQVQVIIISYLDYWNSLQCYFYLIHSLHFCTTSFLKPKYIMYISSLKCSRGFQWSFK